MFYWPSREVLGQPEHEHRDVWIDTEDGNHLHGWWFPPHRPGVNRGTVVQFHGNAGNVTGHSALLEWLSDSGWGLLSFDYRGYGRSSGSPSQGGLQRDALAAIRWALSHEARDRPIFLYGQSLGGAVLVDAFAELTHEERQRVAAVVVEGTFHSYSEMAASVTFRHPLLLPLTGVAYCCVSSAHDAAAALSGISPVPLLVIHGARDDVVPLAFGQAVYDLALPPKELWVIPWANHLEPLKGMAVRRQLRAWLERAGHRYRARNPSQRSLRRSARVVPPRRPVRASTTTK